MLLLLTLIMPNINVAASRLAEQQTHELNAACHLIAAKILDTLPCPELNVLRTLYCFVPLNGQSRQVKRSNGRNAVTFIEKA